MMGIEFVSGLNVVGKTKFVVAYVDVKMICVGIVGIPVVDIQHSTELE